jgi:hypothetical protein
MDLLPDACDCLAADNKQFPVRQVYPTATARSRSVWRLGVETRICARVCIGAGTVSVTACVRTRCAGWGAATAGTTDKRRWAGAVWARSRGRSRSPQWLTYSASGPGGSSVLD